MPNRKILQEAANRRRRKRKSAAKVYRKYQAQVPALIRQLGGPTQAAHDRAFSLLSKMGDNIVLELLEALEDPTLDPIAADEVVSLLGTTGDERARPVLWAFFQANQHDLERASTAALSLSGLGDERVLPFVRESLRSRDKELVANAVASLIPLGEFEDVDRLRMTHLRNLSSSEIRVGVATAILTILEDTDRETFDRTMNEIQDSLVDIELWGDLWHILDSQFGQSS
jgi:HEAT repeat protein